jgi:hypothetical protein
MNPAIIGALINSALYLVCVFVAGLVTGHPWAWRLAIASIGVSFLVCVVELSPITTASKELTRANMLNALIPISWLLGIAAGILLLF